MNEDFTRSLCDSIKQLIAAFDHAANRNPPLYCEVLDTVLIRDCGPDGLAAEEWQAFIDANRAPSHAWEWWEDSHEGPCCLRLFGESKGFDEFQRLAFDVCQTAGLVDDFYADGDWLKWAYLLRLAARDCSVPLLNIRERLWGINGWPDNHEHLANEWIEGANGVTYPPHVLVQQVGQNVFTASATALRIMLDPNAAVSLGCPNAAILDWSPFGDIWSPSEVEGEEIIHDDEPVETPSPKSEVVEITRSDDEPFIFRSEGGCWHLRYTENGIVEDKTFIENKTGLDRVKKVLHAGYKGIPADDIIGVHPARSYSGSNIEFSKDDPDEHGRSNPTPETVCDQETIDRVRAQLADSEEQLAAARATGGGPQAVELQEDINYLKNYLKDAGQGEPHHRRLKEAGQGEPHRRRVRRVANTSHKGKALEAVKRDFFRLRPWLKQQGFPLLARHLRIYVKIKGQGFYYNPEKHVHWAFM